MLLVGIHDKLSTFVSAQCSNAGRQRSRSCAGVALIERARLRSMSEYRKRYVALFYPIIVRMVLGGYFSGFVGIHQKRRAFLFLRKFVLLLVEALHILFVVSEMQTGVREVNHDSYPSCLS